MDCRRRWAVDEDRSRRKWAVDEDRRRIRWAVEEDRRRRRSAIDDDRHRRRWAFDDDRRRRRWTVEDEEDDYPPLQLPLQWRDPLPHYTPLELPLKWRNPLSDHLAHNQPPAVILDSPSLQPYSVADDSAFTLSHDQNSNLVSLPSSTQSRLQIATKLAHETLFASHSIDPDPLQCDPKVYTEPEEERFIRSLPPSDSQLPSNTSRDTTLLLQAPPEPVGMLPTDDQDPDASARNCPSNRAPTIETTPKSSLIIPEPLQHVNKESMPCDERDPVPGIQSNPVACDSASDTSRNLAPCVEPDLSQVDSSSSSHDRLTVLITRHAAVPSPTLILPYDLLQHDSSAEGEKQVGVDNHALSDRPSEKLECLAGYEPIKRSPRSREDRDEDTNPRHQSTKMCEIHVQGGQCGNQIRAKFWEVVCTGHRINALINGLCKAGRIGKLDEACGVMQKMMEWFEKMPEFGSAQSSKIASGEICAQVLDSCKDVSIRNSPFAASLQGTAGLSGLWGNYSTPKENPSVDDSQLQDVCKPDSWISSSIIIVSSCAKGVEKDERMLDAVILESCLKEIVAAREGSVWLFPTYNFEPDASDQIIEDGPVTNIITYNVLLDGYEKAGQIDVTTSEEMSPNFYTFDIFVSKHRKSRGVWKRLVQNLFRDSSMNKLVSMYLICKIFDPGGFLYVFHAHLLTADKLQWSRALLTQGENDVEHLT